MEESILEDKQRWWVPWLAGATALAAVYATAVAWSGGFTLHVGPVRMRSHSWLRPALLAVGSAAVLVYFERTRVTALVTATARALESSRAATTLAVVASAWALIAGLAFGTFAVGGADSYGYAGQARLFAEGRVTDTVPISAEYTWPDVAATFTPLGFTPGRAPGVIAPKYPPGLALLMAPLAATSERAIYFLVPCFGALLVWTTFRLGCALGDPLVGSIASALLSISPTFLYQVVQPMSDVPAAACWLIALIVASRGTMGRSAMSGLISSLAVLIRPNLAPLSGIVLTVATFAPDDARTPSRMRHAAAFGLAMLPALVTLGWLQAVRYGSPLASGYGSVSDAFSASYIVENLQRYPWWVTETHTWFIWISIGAPLWIARRSTRPLLGWAALALALAVWASYLPYLYFHVEEWSYTRFLLPALAIMLLFAVAVTWWVLRQLPVVLSVSVMLLITMALVVHGIRSPMTQGVFELRAQERKYPLAGAFVRDHLPPTAIVVAAQHSGSIRYYAHRPTFRWDLLSPARLDQALAAFRAQGYEPYLVVDGPEYDEFTKRFEAANQRAARPGALLATLGDARVYAMRR